MAFELRPNEKDDPGFIRLIGQVIDRILDEAKPKDAYVIQINNWFDHKWLKFSGIGVVQFDDFRLHIDSALDEFRQDKLTFPPFTPHRVLGQRYFSQTNRADYVEGRAPRNIHKSGRQSSSDNLHRRVSDFSDSGIFVWYSSNTLSNQRGSLMVYAVAESNTTAWFASFRKEQTWKLDFVKGADQNQIRNLVEQAVR